MVNRLLNCKLIDVNAQDKVSGMLIVLYRYLISNSSHHFLLMYVIDSNFVDCKNCSKE